MDSIHAVPDSALGDAAASPEVLVSILNYCDPGKAMDAARSVLHSTYPNFRVLLIDNGSPDDSAETLKGFSDPRVELLLSAVNTGFTGGCNLAFQRARELGVKYVWLLNSDATVPASTLSDLVSVAESDATVGLVGPLIASEENPSEITYAGACIDLEAQEHDTTADVEEGQRWMRERPKQFVVYGTALLVRMEMANKIGGFDEKYFMYWDDYDISLCSSKAGYRNVVSVNSVILHEDKNFHALLDRIKPHYFYYYFRGAFHLWRKHRGTLRSSRAFWRTTRSALRLRRKVGEDSARGEALLAGLWHGLTYRHGEFCPPVPVPAMFRSLMDAVARRVG